MSKIILFNSPKNVGKSKAIEYLRDKGISLISAECKESLHSLTMTLFGVKPERYWEIYNTRELKEVPLEEFRISIEYTDGCALERLIDITLLDREGVLGRDTFIDSKYRYNVRLSIREAMIYVSEVVVKPRWGEDWFGQARVRKMKGFDGYCPFPPIFCDDSCAFVDELHPLIKYLGQENILLLRIHRDGSTFEGDSRNYIPDGVITNTVDVYNNGTEQEYFDKIYQEVTKWLNTSV